MSEETVSGNLGAEAQMAVKSIQDTLDKFLETADVAKVYGERVKNGDVTLIPAGEVICAMGFGMGGGSGSGGENGGTGEGVGGGGGGWAQSRPVAVIIASPSGVRVEPVIDVTKIGLAALTAAGFMAATLLRMTRR
ncbi:MAG TPA: spore germination protein GerW family protein [Anaerolineales bacterium]|nr:spore germination protein GerW family protein [Anaerolineales bacterium]